MVSALFDGTLHYPYKKYADVLKFIDCHKASVIKQNGESQNGCFKKTKHAKFSGKQTFRTP